MVTPVERCDSTRTQTSGTRSTTSPMSPTACFPCFSTGMFMLPNSLSHVTSATFAQARLRLDSGLLTLFTRHGVVKTYLTRNYQLLTRGLKWPLLQLGILNILLLYIYTERYRDINLGSCFRLLIHFNYRLYILKIDYLLSLLYLFSYLFSYLSKPSLIYLVRPFFLNLY